MNAGSAAGVALLVVGIAIGYVLGVEFPACCPGEQRGCNVEDGSLGVQHCRRGGFGWERCQGLAGRAYPRALWRGTP